MSTEELYQVYLRFPSVQTDSRKVKKNDLYFALKGPNFNGNQFAAQALDAGAAFAITDEGDHNDDRILVVPDVLTALQDLAAWHRNTLQIPVLAITGSNGKTTTKELIHKVLSTTYKTYTTEGNLNNHIGVPLTILKISKDAEIAVIEMGANHLHEIEGYCRYANPTHGLITNIGKAHLEGFGGAENVKLGKGELFRFIVKRDGFCFVNADDPSIVEISNVIKRKVTYGTGTGQCRGIVTKNDPYLAVQIISDDRYSIETQLVGTYNASNVVAAVCVGRHFKIEDEKIKKAIEAYAPSNSRSQLIRAGSNTIILDAYNANPGSMKAAIENFAQMAGDNKILLLGDMRELGEDSSMEHRQLVDLISQHTWEKVVLVGENFSETNSPYLHFKDQREAKDWFQGAGISNARILIKGSRGMTMERIIEP